MRKRYELSVPISEGVICEFSDEVLSCKKGDVTSERKISIRGTDIKIDEKSVRFVCEKANKKSIAMIKTATSHVKNMLNGFDEKFIYEMQICHVHFPITVKVESDKIVISNFLGEKVNRIAKILSGVEIEINGQKITISGKDIEKTGQTAANIEKASKVSKRDRRVFQDGIFITSKPGGDI